MRPNTATIFAAALGVLYNTPACAQRQRLAQTTATVNVAGAAHAVAQTTAPVMVAGAVHEDDAQKGNNAMIESVLPAANASSLHAANATFIPGSEVVPTGQPAPGAKPQPPKKAPIPITALLYAGSPGPKQCRGSPMMKIPMERPVSNTTAPQCYNIPRLPANCGTFMAEKEDGCEARVFADWNCEEFENLVVFMPELRTVGGIIRSVEIRCGVVAVEPAPLNMGALGAAQPKPKKPKPAGS
ncbi:hypothetical protein PG996_012153 [Apiospora saccharicola]|uniref:Uncharacterized protein n=1 Tax=Apiospora saccharicola TaxID=335842 RepID=A0ABR1U2B4_9PEZI